MLKFVMYALIGISGIAFGFSLRIIYSMAGALIACGIVLIVAVILCAMGYVGPMLMRVIERLKAYIFQS